MYTIIRKPLYRLTTILLLSITASISPQPSSASLEVLEKAFELNQKQIISLPRTNPGRLSIRPCDDCEAVVLRIYNTRFFVDEMQVQNLAEWLAEEAGASKNTALYYVFYRPEDNTVTRLVLDKGP